MSVNNNHKAGVPAVQNTMADMSVDDAQIRGVRYHEIQARKAYRLADAIYNNFTEAELDRFGTAEERCQLLGLFAYQLMEVANINRVHKGLVFRAAGFNKLGYGKPMKLSLAIARNERARLEEEKAQEEKGAQEGWTSHVVNGTAPADLDVSVPVAENKKAANETNPFEAGGKDSKMAATEKNKSSKATSDK